ncbi:MAG: tetratricopeptide repeat protein [Candidatus Omnitrophota bacterium]|nr:tetratricopeptide repeat protein [Candidatus Omnitrophota bacterium]
MKQASKIFIYVFFISCFLISDFGFRLPRRRRGISDFSYVYAQEAATQEAREHFASGKKLMQEGNYSAADKEFKKAQEILKSSSYGEPGRTTSPDVNQEAVTGKTQKGTKEKYLEPKLEIKPPENTSYYLEAVKKNPKDSDLHYNLAVVYLRNHQYADAARSLKKAVSLNPKDKNAYYNLAVLYESYLNDKKRAFDYYTQYLRLSSKADDTGEIKSWMNQIKKELKESKPHD